MTSPVDWVIVPKTATDAMTEAYWDLVGNETEDRPLGGDVWTAMLAAAPPPPSTEGRERLTAFVDHLNKHRSFISALMAAYPDSNDFNAAMMNLINDLRALLGSQP